MCMWYYKSRYNVVVLIMVIQKQWILVRYRFYSTCSKRPCLWPWCVERHQGRHIHKAYAPMSNTLYCPNVCRLHNCNPGFSKRYYVNDMGTMTGQLKHKVTTTPQKSQQAVSWDYPQHIRRSKRRFIYRVHGSNVNDIMMAKHIFYEFCQFSHLVINPQPSE